MRLHAGVKLLGFRIFYKYKLLKRSNTRRIPYRVQDLVELYADSVMENVGVFESIEGWNAYAVHGNTYKFRRSLMRKLRRALKKADKVSALKSESV